MISWEQHDEKILFKEGLWEVVENGWWDLPISIRHMCPGSKDPAWGDPTEVNYSNVVPHSYMHPWAYHLTTMHQITAACSSCGQKTPGSVVTLFLLVRDNYITDCPWLLDKYF